MPRDTIRVLLVEDNPADARLIRELLAEASAGAAGPTFALTQAARLSDALAPLRAGGADVVLLDLSLPDSFGLETVNSVRQCSPAVPIVVLTGNDDEALAFQVLQQGAQDYLPKTDLEKQGLVRALRFAIERERAERLRSEFVSLVSHELRTPLTSIKGYLDMLLNGEAGPVPAQQREFLDVAKGSADHLVALVNDLLDVSRMEAGRVALKCEPVDLARVLDRVATLLRPQLADKRQHLVLDIVQPLPAIFGDADRLTQVFTNLLSNAHKYTPADGLITVTALAAGDAVRVDIGDTGIGMTPEEQAKLFTKFFRADNRQAREAGGTGLGLVITRALVELHSGRIEVASAPGAGSTFSVLLPVATGAMPLSIPLPTGSLTAVERSRAAAPVATRLDWPPPPTARSPLAVRLAGLVGARRGSFTET